MQKRLRALTLDQAHESVRPSSRKRCTRLHSRVKLANPPCPPFPHKHTLSSGSDWQADKAAGKEVQACARTGGIIATTWRQSLLSLEGCEARHSILNDRIVIANDLADCEPRGPRTAGTCFGIGKSCSRSAFKQALELPSGVICSSSKTGLSSGSPPTPASAVAARSRL